MVKERPSFRQADVWEHLRTGLVAHMLSEVMRDGVVDGFVLTGAFFNEHVALPVVRAGQATGEFIHKRVVEPVVESPTFKAMSFAAQHAAHQTHEFFHDKVRSDCLTQSHELCVRRMNERVDGGRVGG